jgi:hypothetical protein
VTTVTPPIVYSQCGLRIRSAIELHLPLAPGGEWDVNVVLGGDIHDSTDPPPGEVIAAYGSGEDSWYTATSTGTGFRIRFRDCGEFVISDDLAEVEVRRAPSGRADLLPILLAGTVSAFLLTLRGHTVLHASAVAIDGSALAFVGQSGRGKTTLAALLCVGGAQLVTDDVLTVEAGPPVQCLGGASELRLRSAASPIADIRPHAKTRSTADQRLALALESAPLVRHPLAAIVVPAPSRTATDVEVRRLAPSMAVFRLLSFPRVHGWSRHDVLSRDFSTFSAIVNSVPVYDVTVPWGPPFRPEVARSLAALVDAPVGDPAPTA